MTNRRFYLHYLGLAGVIAIGVILRFTNLDLKPLWMDEVITTIFSLGKQYSDLPLDVVFSLERLQEIFSYQSGVSCSQIAHTVASQSTHPPLFFCLMHTWLGWVSPLGKDWVMKLRSLPALFGVCAIVAIYCVNRLAFSKVAGLMAAMLMAISPFAVYLSQEARHYTLPMLLITLSLLGLIQIQQDIFKQQRLRIWVWLIWTVINIIGIYVHYFFVIAFIGEIGTLLALIYCHQQIIQNQRQIFLALIISVSVVALAFLPWLPVFVNTFSRPETGWLDPPMHIAPFYQTLIGWIIMVIFLPVENQSLSITIISALLMLIFGLWTGWYVGKGLKKIWSLPKFYLPTFSLVSFTIFVLLEFFAIAYLLGRDITAIPRYNFIYYPSFCALMGASLVKIKNSKFIQKNSNFFYYKILRYHFYFVIIIGLVSSIFVINNLAFIKPYQPNKVAQIINQEPSIPVMVVVGYQNYQDVALGLSFALALKQVRSSTTEEWKSSNFAFFQQSPSLDSVWQKISQLPAPKTQLNLWVVAPGLKRRDYPEQVTFSQATTCIKDTTKHYRVGIPYQLYRCAKI